MAFIGGLCVGLVVGVIGGVLLEAAVLARSREDSKKMVADLSAIKK